ncbi:MAG: formate/nitrite transporter family protein [Anaerolineales bacterium]
MVDTNISVDDLTPAQIADKVVTICVKKTGYEFWTMFALALFGGAFIAFGAIIATTVGTLPKDFPFGVAAILKGLVFTVGLILVIVGGAELFTGNNLILLAVLCNKARLSGMLRNWVVVYLGNFVGAIIIAILIALSRQYTMGGGGIGQTMFKIAEAKSSLAFGPAVALGILCNILVCMAVWMAISARTTAGKIAAIIPPIATFVAAGFEHSIANMYFMPVALFIKAFDPAFVATLGFDIAHVTWGNFLANNLLPVTIGNIIGGTIFVDAMYWFIFLRDRGKVLHPQIGRAYLELAQT